MGYNLPPYGTAYGQYHAMPAGLALEQMEAQLLVRSHPV
eukprot:COSAG01_NODE_32441_length_581_cov_0.943983_1_plen_39_part_00